MAAACGLLVCQGGCGLTGGWKAAAVQIAGAVTLGAEHGTVFYAFDTLAHPAAEAELKTRVLGIHKLQHVKGVTVEYLLGEESVGSVATDEDGYATLKWPVPGPGRDAERQKRSAPADYEFSAKIVGVPDDDYDEMLKVTPAPLLVSVRAKDTRFVVIDLDHTVVASGFARVLIGGAKPMPRAAEAVRELSTRYSIIYLTHRPELLSVKSKRWLSDNGFVRAPLLVSTLGQALGDSGKYKAAKLRELRRQFPGLAIGIGDKLSDADAYAANGMKAYLIPHYKPDKHKDVRKMADGVRRLKGGVQVVDDWDELRAGVFQDRRFTAKAYAKKLDARAKLLAREEKRRKKDDDDDDDD